MKSHPTQFWKVTDGAAVVVFAAVVGSAAAAVVVGAVVVVEKQKLGFLFLLNRGEPNEKKGFE